MLTQTWRLCRLLRKITLVIVIPRVAKGSVIREPVRLIRGFFFVRIILNRVQLGDAIIRNLNQVSERLREAIKRGVPIVYGIVTRIVVQFEERIFLNDAFYFLVQFDCRKLQQPYGVLQLRGKRQVLRQLELESR